MKPRTFKKKSPFDALSNEFKDAIAQSSPEEIKTRIANTVLEHETLMKAKEDDQDWQKAKTAYEVANETYAQSRKLTKLKVSFCRQVLEDKGKA